MKCSYNNGNTTTNAMMGRVSDNQGRESFMINPDINGTNNMTLFTGGGAIVIGEGGPCSLTALNATHDARLYVLGSAYNKELMWSTMATGGSPGAQKSASESPKESMDKLRTLNLYGTGEGREVGINIREVRESLPMSVGRVEYNGKEFDTFNGTQLFYHYLGGIRYLDKQDQILMDELETERARNDELEQKLNEQEERIDELQAMMEDILSGTTNLDTPDTPQNSSKILNIFPNPTANVINIEVGFEQGAKDVKVHIFDMSGNYILTQSITTHQQVTTINLDRYNLPTGQYNCTLITDGRTADTKIISFTN